MDHTKLQQFAEHLEAQFKKMELMLPEGTAAGQLHKVLPPAELPLAKIDHYTIADDDKGLLLENLRAAVNGRPDRALHPGTYTRLITRDSPEDKWQLMMVDTHYEIRSANIFIARAMGDVLVMGLGLGATLIPVLRKQSVRAVTVVEANQDVIQLVAPGIRRILESEGEGAEKKLKIIHDDAFEWKAPRGQLYDTIWLDIWPEISQKNLPGIVRLRRKYSRKLNSFFNKKAWIGAWEEKFLRKEQAEDRARPDPWAAVGGKLETHEGETHVMVNGKRWEI